MINGVCNHGGEVFFDSAGNTQRKNEKRDAHNCLSFVSVEVNHIPISSALKSKIYSKTLPKGM